VQRATEHNLQPEMPPQANKPKQPVRLRWLTAVVAMPIVLVFTYLGGWWSFLGLAFVVFLSIYELYTMLLHAGYRPIMPITVGLCLLFLIAAMLPLQQQLLLLEIGLSASLLISLPWLFFRKNLDGAMLDWALTLAIAVYVGWGMSAFLLLRGYESPWPFSTGPWWLLPRGIWWSLVVLLGVWGFDGAAFFAGRYFGRHKLAPHVSPAKTWEGVAGGLILSIMAALVLTVKPLGVPWYLAILLGVLVGLAAVLGDLAESLLKRQTHVKDSGNFMPGHGGMLDRIDSLIFAVIVVYLFTQFVGR
jgi:phosphatidate cytidylyltransferase